MKPCRVFAFAFLAVLGFVALARAQTFATPTFDSGVGTPTDVACGDVNGDGKPDALVSDSGSTRILLGNGLGGFGAPATLAGARYQALVADMDNDGKKDVVAGASPSGASVFLGDGAGGFPNMVNVTNGSLARFAIGDLDGNGLLDFVGVSGSNVFAGLNAGGASFPNLVNNPAPGGSNLNQVLVADVNADGKVDIVVSGGTLIYLGNGTAQLAAPIAVYGYGPLAVLDVNQDGKLDVASCGGGIRVALGPTFTTTVDYATPNGAVSACTADFNADGRTDLCLGKVSEVRVLPAAANGGFLAAKALSWVYNASVLVTASDLNGDGKADLVAASSYRLLALLGQGSAGLPFPKAFSTGTYVQTVATGDLNGDGNLDWATAGDPGFLTGYLPLFFGDGKGGALASSIVASSDHPWNCVAIGDVNRDGNLDLLAGGRRQIDPNPSENYLSLFHGNGLGGFSLASHSQAAPNQQGTPWKCLLLDSDLDGVLDAVVATGYELTLARGKVSGASFEPPIVLLAGGASDILSDDFDGNGMRDLTDGVHVLFGVGPALFTPPVALGLGGSFLASGDINGDHAPDLFAQGWLFLNDNAGGFQLGQNLGTGYVQDLADLDGDGALDAASSSGPNVDVSFGTGTGTFASSYSFASGVLNFATSQLDAVLHGDFNSDGRTDLLTAGGTSAYNISVLLNTTPTPAATTLYGSGTPGCAGKLGVAPSSLAKVNNAAFGLAATNAPVLALGAWMITDAQDAAGSDPFGLGLKFHVNLFAATFVLTVDAKSDAAGRAYTALPIPNNSALAGNTYYAQSLWVEDPANQCSKASIPLVSSKGLAFTVQP